jgi:hypothetical protein
VDAVSFKGIPKIPTSWNDFSGTINVHGLSTYLIFDRFFSFPSFSLSWNLGLSHPPLNNINRCYFVVTLSPTIVKEPLATHQQRTVNLAMEEVRTKMIQEEVDRFVAKAEKELENPMNPEGKEAFLKAALKLAYTHKYYNRSTEAIELIPTLTNLLLGIEIYEEAEKYYFEEADVFPLKYTAALKEAGFESVAAGATVPAEFEAEDMERMKEPIGEDDVGLFQKTLTEAHKHQRQSMENPYSQEINKIVAEVEEAHKGETYLSREAIEALKLAAVTVGDEYSAFPLCLMDDKIYDEAKEFLDDDGFPPDVKEVFKAAAMKALAHRD